MTLVTPSLGDVAGFMTLMSIYAYIYIYIYTCIFIYIYIGEKKNTIYTPEQTHTHIYIYIYTCIYIYVCVCVFWCIYCVHFFHFLCVHIFAANLNKTTRIISVIFFLHFFYCLLLL